MTTTVHVVEVAEEKIESRCVKSISLNAIADILFSWSSERPIRVALNTVSDDLLVTTEALSNEILTKEDGEMWGKRKEKSNWWTAFDARQSTVLGLKDERNVN